LPANTGNGTKHAFLVTLLFVRKPVLSGQLAQSSTLINGALVTRLPRVKSGLLTHHLDGQVVAYDAAQDRVHLLDATTGAVLNLLSENRWTSETLVGELKARTGVDATEDLVVLAIDELRKSGLLEADAVSAPLSEMSRRDAMRRIAAAGIGAMLVPAVLSLTPSAANAQSACTGNSLPSGCPCSGNGNCASNDCTGPVGGKTCT
jgi:hypothetical protein